MPSLIYIRFTEGANSLTVNKRNSRINESSRISESSTLVDISLRSRRYSQARENGKLEIRWSLDSILQNKVSFL
jgi:hypothetical protein